MATIDGTAGNDTFNGLGGSDTAQIAAPSSSVTFPRRPGWRIRSMDFSESPENQAALVGAIEQGIAYG